MDEQALQQKQEKLEAEFTINQQPVHFEHQLLDPQTVPQQVEETRHQLRSFEMMNLQTLQGNQQAATPVAASQQPGQVIEQAPQKTYKQRRELEKQRKKDISDGKAITRNADSETIKIVRKMRETAPTSDGPDGFAKEYTNEQLDAVINKLVNSRVTPDMFTPENFAANSSMLRELVYKYKKISTLMEKHPEYFEKMQKDEGFKFKALDRCMLMAKPLEHMFMVASGASGLTTEGEGIKEKSIVEHARSIRDEQLKSFRESVKQNDEQREKDISGELNEKLRLATAEYQTITKPEFQKLYHADNPKMDWIKVPSFNYMPYFEETQALRELIEAKGERYLQNKAVVDKMFGDVIGSLELYGELKAKSTALCDVQAQYQGYMNKPRGGDGDVMFRRVTGQISRLGDEGIDVNRKFELVKNALKVLLKGETPKKTDKVILGSYGYGGVLDPIRENATHLVRRTKWQKETLDRLIEDPRVHLLTTKESEYVTRASSMFREGDDAYNIGILNFLQNYQKIKGTKKPTPEKGPEALAQYQQEQMALYRETKQTVMSSVQKVLSLNLDETLALNEEELALKQAEFDSSFGDNMFVADLMKLIKPDQADIRSSDDMHEGDETRPDPITLKEDILGDRMDEYVLKLNVLRGLAEKSRGLAMKSAARFGLLDAGCFTETEHLKIEKPEDMSAFADSRIRIGNQMIEINKRSYEDEHNPNSDAFKGKCRKLYRNKTGFTMLPSKETPFDAITQSYYRLFETPHGDLSPNEAAIVGHLHGENYRLAGWSEKEAKESGYPTTIGEPIFRSFDPLNSYEATKTMTAEEYKQMVQDLSAGGGMESGVTPPEELKAAREQNMRGARQYKENVRLQYDMLSRKYGTAIEDLSVLDIYNHYEEIIRDLANVQVDLDFITKMPGLMDQKNPEDKVLSSQVQYFSILGYTIQNSMQLFAQGGIPQEQITEMTKTMAAQCSDHKQTLLENRELSHITDHADWTQKVKERRRPIV